jgi:glycosyltransferase involved in cell wall biosynthesis
MKFLYIGSGDVFSRHELGFIAALSALGDVDVIVLGSKVNVEKMKVGSDNGVWNVTFYSIPCENMFCLSKYKTWIEEIVDTEKYHAIFATPRLPVLIAKSLSNKRHQVILRLWSIRAAKVVNNMRLGCYPELLVYLPSIIANLFYISNSTYVMTLDNVTFTFARKAYPLLTHRLTKIYPPYGYITTRRPEIISSSKNAKFYESEVIERGDYILGFTGLSKRGVYLEAEAKPQAEALYLIAKKLNVDVVLAGSTLEDWKQVFPGIEPPKNLHIIGKGFSDQFLAKLYSNARIVVLPISFLSISNRFLEVLFYGKPVVTTIFAKHLHPELIHGRHFYLSNNIVQDVKTLLKLEEFVENLRQGAKEAYNVFFSTKRNLKILRSMLTSG